MHPRCGSADGTEEGFEREEGQKVENVGERVEDFRRLCEDNKGGNKEEEIRGKRGEHDGQETAKTFLEAFFRWLGP